MPRLTILMPAYNAAKYISEAVNSLLNQTFSDFELWIIDDASTDETPALIKSFEDARVKSFTNPTNLRRVRTINKFVKEVQSPFFTITDADDISHPTRLEKQIQLLESDTTLMMCGTSFWAVDEDGFLVRNMKLLSDVDALRKMSLKQSQFLGPTTVMRKEIVKTFPHFYREYFIDNHADADLSGLILDKYNCTNLPESLYYYRILKSSVTRKKVTVRNLNLHRLMGYLSQQRRETGVDCLQRNEPQEADDFLTNVQKEYDIDTSFFFRHQAFFHLYWGLMDLAFVNMLRAIGAKPFKIKSWLCLPYIVLRIGIFYLNHAINKRHYIELISTNERK
jgi:glycosyltransferase involved in cell wall biosynthesis